MPCRILNGINDIPEIGHHILLKPYGIDRSACEYHKLLLVLKWHMSACIKSENLTILDTICRLILSSTTCGHIIKRKMTFNVIKKSIHLKERHVVLWPRVDVTKKQEKHVIFFIEKK